MSLYSALEKHDLDKRSAVVAHFELADSLWRWNLEGCAGGNLEGAEVKLEPLRISVEDSRSVAGLLLQPPGVRACYVFAHGAGAGMTHRFMVDVADGLAERDIATLRFQFPYMENGGRRTDVPSVAHATVRAAVMEAAKRYPGLPLLAGGKSYGGRMTSQTQALQPLSNVQGLVFFGFPLHQAAKPSIERAHHLADVHVPMLFIQGTRDKLAEPALIERVVKTLGENASLHEIAGADHSLHVPLRSGRRDADVLNEALDSLLAWLTSIAVTGRVSKS